MMSEAIMPYYTPIVTLLAVLFYVFLATRVSVARGKFDVKLPATTGNPDFERIFRAHMNTLEWMPTFLVPLWLCAVYLSDIAAAVLGLVWIVGRAMWVQKRRREAAARLLRSGDRMPTAVDRGRHRDRHAFLQVTQSGPASRY
jgi:glutathione S-transferase